MGFPSYLESIGERLVESLSEHAISTDDRKNIPISLDEIKKAVKRAITQAIPQNFVTHLDNPLLDKEFYYKMKHEKSELEAKGYEYKLEKQVERNRSLVAENKDLNDIIRKLHQNELNFRGEAHSLLEENRRLRVKGTQLEEELVTSTKNFRDKIEKIKSECEKQIRSVQVQSIADISDWEKSTDGVRRTR